MKGLWKWCVRCGRELHDHESQTIGMGSRCAALPGSKKVLDLIEEIRQPKLIEGEDGCKKEKH